MIFLLLLTYHGPLCNLGHSLSRVDSWDEPIPSPNYSPSLTPSDTISTNAMKISNTSKAKINIDFGGSKNAPAIPVISKPKPIIPEKPREDDIFASMGFAAAANRNSSNTKKTLPSTGSRWATNTAFAAPLNNSTNSSSIIAPANTKSAPVPKAADLLSNDDLGDADWGDDDGLDDLDNDF